MHKTIKLLPAALALTFGFVSIAIAQQSSNPTPTPVDNYVTEKSFKSKVFEIKYREPNSLVVVLKQLGSGFKGATISPSSEFKTITARDFPENLTTIEEAIKRLDVPSAPRPNIELHLHVLVASNAAPSGMEVPAELKDVLAELRGTLNYKTYELAASVVLRLAETPRGFQGSGAAELPTGNPGAALAVPYDYFINSVALVPDAAGSMSVQISEFKFSATFSASERAAVQTALNLRDGEKVVVGSATIRSRALVVVLTAKLLK
jgi:hypothetical protein